MKVYETKDIRNIALVGGAKSGKTTLAEDMLFEGGVINRRGSVDDKNSVSDYRPIEIERQNSIFSTVLYTEFNGKKINIIDTPGFDDFVGEVAASLKVVDTAVILVNAQNRVEVGTEIAWRYTDKYNTPVVFVINHLEHENSNFDDTIRQLKSQFGGSLSICQYPVNTGHGLDSVIDLIQMKMFKFSEDGGKPEITDIPDSENFAMIVKASFKQRRKTLRNNLKGILTESEIVAAGVDPSVRAETLSLENFAALAKQIK